MNTYLECRTCLGKFTDNDTVHVETKVINQKNVLQAIEEVASIEVFENDGLPEHICKNCFTSLESSITFRKQVIISDIELKRRLIPEIHSVNLSNDPLLLSNGNRKEQSDESKLHLKEENEEFDLLLEKKENIPLKAQIKGNNDISAQPSEEGSDNDWNNANEDTGSSDDFFNEETNEKSLRKPKAAKNKNKTDLNDDNNFFSKKSNRKGSLNSANQKLTAAHNKDGTNFSEDNDNLNHLIHEKSKNKSPSTKASAENEWSDFSDNSNSSDNFFKEKQSNKASLKPSYKKSAIETRKIRRKRRVAKKPIKDISDTSSDSDSDSDIPLGELRKEIKDLENKIEPKVRKKREKKEKADGPRLCPICGKLFKARQNFNSHMTTVHRKKPDKPEKISCLCPDCGRVITGTRQNFVAHRRYHHSDKAQVKKRFTCDVCPRKFYREKNLIIHQRIHKGEKGYVCELCPDKSYTQIGGLILHKRKVHLKKPTCTCNYCGKQFYEKHYLETHIRQWHTGERPFSCEICGKSFSCNGTLLRHRKDSHGEKQPCPKCGKMYTEGELRKHLKRHKIREEGIKRKKYTCEYCGTEMNFTSRKRHLLKQHGIMLRGRGETAERIPISRADAM